MPFCLTRCGYCDFNAYAGLDHLAPRYVRALLTEAGLAAPAWSEDEVVSIFFGGGTPTTLDVADLKGVLTHVRDRFAVRDDAEVSIEANPDTVDIAKLDGLLAAGFDRLSMGAQSFDRGVLESLERLHSPDSVRRAFVAARAAGYDNVNLDLIYGADGEGLDSWERTLEQAIDLSPEHVSAYALTIEPATALGRKVSTGAVPPPDPDLQADMFSAACDLLRDAGYHHYEVSNWAKPGFECRHNLGYWERAVLRRSRRRRALVPRRPPVVEHPSARGVHEPRRGGGAADSAATSISSRRTPTSRRCSSGCGSCRASRRRGSTRSARSRSWRAACCRRTTARWCRRSAACCC